MIVVFSDLDGTLLDHETYDFSPAMPALDLLSRLDIPLVLASSKTEAEMRPIAAAMGLSFPMIVENGAGVAHTGDGSGDDRETYTRIRNFLETLPSALSRRFAGFGDWSTAEVSRRTGLPTEAAERARQRRFSEPGLFSGTPDEKAGFLERLDNAGFTATQGGRFLTIMPKTSKAERMVDIATRYGNEAGTAITTIALGDAANDLAMLQAADTGVIIANPAHAPLPVTERERKGFIVRSTLPGPSGWNEMILKLVTG
ncbi:HAD-IIB family hydrolase [Ciceribacter sp. L1K23]|uniref:HAD-IIB family hydrolase n=1 Tax=Ciceribacter sp. L1K23 TaxID=2820276 RepID=UPI001B82D269|nr:HAD-IIB family hydrolase [Ciceribacter sp. L1K23]MBR0555943.1 HAD-IIB family hydrolase [Ciceribacter sp. L1K23]